ncbi:MAG TPA: aspartate/glutamate racemase family protein [Steroidobacteraceae bacterium]|nr:aspartate/glutamate racemase family protein [Steroidobacteraceae bacterium]
MKTIGLIGGMSWESTVPYYREINETIRDRLGGLHSAKIVLYSVDFHEIEALQRSGDWSTAGRLLSDAAQSLQRAGADFLVIGANTMHKVVPAIEGAIALPILHIADCLAEELKAAQFSNVGLLGTRFTMEQDFYKDRLRQRHGIEALVPNEAQRERVHRIIYDELCVGRIESSSREEYRSIIADLVARGAQAIVLGCTEIAMLIDQQDSAVPLFDTAKIHARSAALYALS